MESSTASQADVRSPQVLPLMRAGLPSMQPSDAKVARVVLDEPEATIYRSVSEVAEAAGTSSASVVRCAQNLGFAGFHALKLALAQELATFDTTYDKDDVSGGDVISRMAEAAASSIRDTSALVDRAAFAAAVDALATARRVLVVGIGTSAPLAQDAGYRLRTLGIAGDSPGDVHVQHVAARMLGSDDVCLAVSHTGSTRETLEAVTAAKQVGARTIAITSFLRSPLTEVADIVLTAGTRELSFRLEAMASRLAHMVVIDALLVGVADHDPDRARASLDAYSEVLSQHRL